MQYANYRIWKSFKTLCSCKCLSPPPYLKFTLSPMYIKNKTQRKKGKRNSQFQLLGTQSQIIGPILILSGMSRSIMGHFSQSFFSVGFYRADIGTIPCYRATAPSCIPPIPSLLGPSGRDMSKQTTPILVVCYELIVCSSKPENKTHKTYIFLVFFQKLKS